MDLLSQTFGEIWNLDLLLAIGIAILGGLMHGFTGWGGAMVMMPLMTLIFGPVEALGIIIIGGILVSIQLYPDALRKTDWREMAPLLVAVVLTVPLGAWTLFHLEPDTVRRGIGIFIIASTLVLMTGWTYKGRRGWAAGGTAGALCGYINGFAGIGGGPLVIYVLSADRPHDVHRANIVIAVGVVTVVIVVSLTVGSAWTLALFLRALIITPFQMLGGWLGARLFQIAPGRFFRSFSLVALLVLGIASVVL